MLAAWFKGYQDNAFALFDQLPLNDHEAREKIVLSISIVRKLESSLRQYVEEGEMSEKDIARLLELKKKGFLGGLFGE